MDLPNTTGVKPGDDFAPIEEGWYSVYIKKGAVKTSQKGTQYIKFWFGADTGYDGTIWGDVSLNLKKLGKLKELRDACGVPDTDKHLESFSGKTCWAYCVDDNGYAKATKYAKEKPIENSSPDSVPPEKGDDSDLPF